MVQLNLELFLKPEDLNQKKTSIEFVDEGSIRSAEDTGFDRESFDITIKLPDGSKRVWTMNKTSQRAIATAFGEETANWIGKKINLVKKEQNVRGKMKQVIYAGLE